MYENSIELLGDKSGPVSIILVGVHGNEKCGIYALEKILPSLKIESGRVLIVYGNPKAIDQNVRYVEVNLNRMFKLDKNISEEEKKSYEYGRAQFIKKYLEQADVLLDIHASFTPNSSPFVICESNAKGIIEYLPSNLVVSGFDKVEPGGTDYYMNSIGKVGICFECGYLGDSKSIYLAEESVYAFLKARGHIQNDLIPREQTYINMYDLYLTKTKKFSLVKDFIDFEIVLKDQDIGIDGEKIIKAKKDSVILFARNVDEVGEEAFLIGENKNSLA